MPWDFMGRNGNVPQRRKPAKRPFRNGGRTSAVERATATRSSGLRNRGHKKSEGVCDRFAPVLPSRAPDRRRPLASRRILRPAAGCDDSGDSRPVTAPRAPRDHAAAPRGHPIPAFSQPARPEVGLAAFGAYRLGRPHFGSGPRPGEKGMRCGPEAKPAAAPATVSGERPRTRPLPHMRREGPGRMPGPASQETCRGDHPVRARGAPGTTDLSVAVAPRPVRARARA